jgi:hypothetical protein
MILFSYIGQRSFNEAPVPMEIDDDLFEERPHPDVVDNGFNIAEAACVNEADEGFMFKSNLTVNTAVIIVVTGKKCSKKYVALVLSNDVIEKEVNVQFLEPCLESKR